MVKLEANENQSVLQLAVALLQGDPLTPHAQQSLAQIAERCCCTRHHRIKIWGSGLADSLATLWQAEIRDALFATRQKPASPATCKIMSPHNTHNSRAPKKVAFSKHSVLDGQPLATALLSDIDLQAPKEGIVYIFTYTKSSFNGMLKIGFTTSIDNRMGYWAECSHGSPSLLSQHANTRHPERVELLVHFELVEHWYALRWCNIHLQAHIEWFKIGVLTADRIIQSWAARMKRANPYDRRGRLKPFWQEIMEFLAIYEISITAELMMQIQEVEEGLLDLTELLDDDALRQVSRNNVKGEQASGNTSTPTQIGAQFPTAMKHEAESVRIKKEITDSQPKFTN